MPSIQEYYEKLESRYGYYIVMRQSQHIGYYSDPENAKSETESDAQKNMHDKIVEYLKPVPEHKILDAGCGQGFVAVDLAERYGLHITGIDITPYIVKRAKEYAEKKGLGDSVTFIEGDYSRMDFPDESFDHIYAVETLCHSADMEIVLKEFWRVLKPGGRFLSLEYVLRPEHMDATQYAEFYSMTAEYSASPGLHFFEEGKFTELAEKVGFTTIDEIEVTEHCLPSVDRLTRLARIPYIFVRLFGLEKKLINVWMGAHAKDIVRSGTFGYMHRLYQKK
jgi:sterol 24-C-methyltransferase